MEKSINIHRALRATLRLLFTSILSIAFGTIGVLIGLLAEIIIGVCTLSNKSAQLGPQLSLGF